MKIAHHHRHINHTPIRFFSHNNPDINGSFAGSPPTLNPSSTLNFKLGILGPSRLYDLLGWFEASGSRHASATDLKAPMGPPHNPPVDP